MPKKTDPKHVRKIFYLRHLRGMPLDAICEVLEREDNAPERTTVARYLRRFKEAPPDAVAEEYPFRWGELQGVPWEDSRVVLDACKVVSQLDRNAPWVYFPCVTRRLAKWIWRVNCVTRGLGLTTLDVITIAQEYAIRELLRDYLEEEFQTEDLDTFLEWTPWVSQAHLCAYNEARLSGSIPLARTYHCADETLEDARTVPEAGLLFSQQSVAAAYNLWTRMPEGRAKELRQWALNYTNALLPNDIVNRLDPTFRHFLLEGVLLPDNYEVPWYVQYLHEWDKNNWEAAAAAAGGRLGERSTLSRPYVVQIVLFDLTGTWRVTQAR